MPTLPRSNSLWHDRITPKILSNYSVNYPRIIWTQMHSDKERKQTHLKGRPNVKGNLLMHDKVQETTLFLVLDLTTRGFNFLLQLAVPLPSIWKMNKPLSPHPEPNCKALPVVLWVYVRLFYLLHWFIYPRFQFMFKFYYHLPGRDTLQCVSVNVVLISSILCTPSPQRSLTVTSLTFCFQSTNTSEKIKQQK